MMMSFKRELRWIWAPARDFVCAFVVFVLVFSVLVVDRSYGFELPVITLARAADVVSGIPPVRAWGALDVEIADHVLASRAWMPTPALAMTVLAMIFATIVAFNLALLRHLRRVHASSRRGVWRGN
ncbi:MAG: hypothetical protein KDJ36_08545 [Hyphomicrobiaceae bacterium]|nr:hypothetical protein [Hyphomicrobiaceae bacterium]